MPGMISGGMPGMMPPMTDAPMGGGQASPGFGAFNLSRSPEYAAAHAQAQIRQLEKQLAEAQQQYAMTAAATNNPQTLAALQGHISGLQQQIESAKQSAQQRFAMDALKMSQRSQMLKNPSVGGGSGAPNEAAANMAQQISLLARMFGGGMGAGRMW